MYLEDADERQVKVRRQLQEGGAQEEHGEGVPLNALVHQGGVLVDELGGVGEVGNDGDDDLCVCVCRVCLCARVCAIGCTYVCSLCERRAYSWMSSVA